MNKIKGDNYEIQIRNYIINTLGKPAYLWHHTPETILINNGIIGSHNDHRLKRKDNKENSLQDTGIDIIQIEENERESARIDFLGDESDEDEEDRCWKGDECIW